MKKQYLKYALTKRAGQLIGLTLILVGCILTISSFSYEVTEESWRMIVGFVTAACGIFTIAEMNQYRFKNSRFKRSK